jgi:OOP family OmpA-OmpF porin
VISAAARHQDFVGDAFEPRADGGLRTFSVGDVTVLVEAGPRALLAAVVRGQHPPALLEHLQETLELLHLHFAVPLAEFAGDAAAFEPATPILAECLEAVVATDRPRRRRLAVRFAWGIAALVVLAVVASLVLRQRRWQRALAALDAEPGIVVLEADRGWRTWRIAGLRDPLAAEPAAVLTAAGADTTRVAGTWTSYLSIEPPLVVARARRTLAAPTTVQLRLAGDTLIAEGAASTDWIARARTHADLMAGVSAFRDAGVTPEIPATCAPSRTRSWPCCRCSLPARSTAGLESVMTAAAGGADSGRRQVPWIVKPRWSAGRIPPDPRGEPGAEYQRAAAVCLDATGCPGGRARARGSAQ